jgi:hypothetical protein
VNISANHEPENELFPIREKESIWGDIPPNFSSAEKNLKYRYIPTVPTVPVYALFYIAKSWAKSFL